MAEERLRIYERHNVSDHTDLRVCGNRIVRPRGCLIHTTSGTDSQEWLQTGSANRGTPASADYLIKREGTVLEITPEGHYAYHAGQSLLKLERWYSGNEVSQVLIGVELENLDIQEPTFEQYDSLGALIVSLVPVWGWRWPFFLYGHYAVARPLGRRSDPVNFDWGWLMGRLYVRSLVAQVPGLAGG